MKVIILAAGIGSRLGRPYPKPLTPLANGKSIMETQIEALSKYVNINNIFVIVGYKKELIMESFPQLTYVYNNVFDTTNTSKSLLKGMSKIENEDVLWLNGDVVFDHSVLERVIQHKESCMAVNTEHVAEEEVKYITDSEGYISEVSKIVKDAEGEAVGINKLIATDIPLMIRKLEVCLDQDYFERAIELGISEGLRIKPVNISDVNCTEIDFEEDLNRVNSFFRK